MSTLHKDFVTAILRSLRRGKSLLQAIMDFFKPTPRPAVPMAQTTKSAHAPLPSNPASPQLNESSSSSTAVAESSIENENVKTLRNLKDFLKEAESQFLGRTNKVELLKMAQSFKVQFLDALQTGEINMLPSYSYRLPSGTESGQFLAADMGGSNLRIALIELRGYREDATGVAQTPTTELLVMKNFRVSEEARNLAGMAFFEWMAARIHETLSEARIIGDDIPQSTPLPLSLAWSFPIDQTSVGNGRLLDMGKGLRAVEGLRGADIGNVMEKACALHGMSIELKAILNDSTACLLSQSYTHLSTRMGLILGTGTNIAAFLPVGAIGKHKFGTRLDSWWDAAAQVVVNTEVSMVGKEVLPMTRWDSLLKDAHERPDFQPLEQMVSGMYLGEICRLVLVEAIETTGLLGGEVPESLMQSYSLATETVARIECDMSDTLSASIDLWRKSHPSIYEPTSADLRAIRTIASLVARRSSALVATAVFALWDLRSSLSRDHASSFPYGDVRRHELEAEGILAETSVAFNGSVIEKYPGYLENCTQVLDRLVDSKVPGAKVRLVMAQESSLFGAAIALACEER